MPTLGKDGGIAVGATEFTFIDSMTLTSSAPTIETPYYGAAYIPKEQGIPDWTVSCSGTLDRADTNQEAWMKQLETTTQANQAIRIFDDTSTKYWKGNARVESFTITSAVQDKVAISFNLVGNSVLDYKEDGT